MTQTIAQANIADRSTARMMTADRGTIYLACEDMDLVWSLADVIKFDSLWRRGKSITVIADILERDTDEVAILAIDRARHGKIGTRQGGVFGGSGAGKTKE